MRKKSPLDIYWLGDEDDSPARSFRAEVASNGGWSLFIQGHYNQRAARLTYALILRSVGRIYGLCLGKLTTINFDAHKFSWKHMHRWTERYLGQGSLHSGHNHCPGERPDSGLWRQF